MSARLTVSESRRVRVGVRVAMLMAAAGLAAVPATADLRAQTVAASGPAVTAFPEPISQAYILPIYGTITDVTKESMERRLKSLGEAQPPLVIIELDTPGGAVLATIEICDMIKNLRDNGTKVYAWVNNEAYSAGTIIALATDGIVMARNATIGDCQPIQFSSEGPSAIPESIRAKAVAPLEAELEDSARRNGYDYKTLLGLVDPEVSLYWLVNGKTGEKRLVDTAGRDKLFGVEQKEESGRSGGLLKRLSSSSEGDKPEPAAADVQSQTDWRYVENDPVLGRIDQPVDGPNQLLTMRTDKATAFGFCKATITNEAELRTYFNVTGTLTRVESNWIESFIEWLASPLVRAVLFLIMLLGIYAELHAPGLSLAGAIALICLVLFLGAPYLTGLAVTWEIVAVVLGAILLLVEIFVIPGFGVAGVLGIILMSLGLLFSFAPSEPGRWPVPTLKDTFDGLKSGLYAMAAGLTGSLVGMYFLARYFPKLPVASSAIAPNPEHEDLQMDDPYPGVARVGDSGTAESLLRPAGKARFGQTLVDVVSEGEYIESGSRVVVVERKGNRVVVRRMG